MEDYVMNTSKTNVNNLFSSQISNGKKGFSIKITSKPIKKSNKENKND
jgi:hypothetical protein